MTLFYKNVGKDLNSLVTSEVRERLFILCKPLSWRFSEVSVLFCAFCSAFKPFAKFRDNNLLFARCESCDWKQFTLCKGVEIKAF